MEQKLIESIMVGLTGILTAIVGYLCAKAKVYIDKKTALIDQQYGKGESDRIKTIAMETYFLVEQQYKGVENVANAKITAFDQYLLNKIPGLTQVELDHLRESICGEINSKLK